MDKSSELTCPEPEGVLLKTELSLIQTHNLLPELRIDELLFPSERRMLAANCEPKLFPYVDNNVEPEFAIGNNSDGETEDKNEPL